ncbi:MAG: alpha/beta fold hydrolase [Actinomycetota bacterium]
MHTTRWRAIALTAGLTVTAGLGSTQAASAAPAGGAVRHTGTGTADPRMAPFDNQQIHWQRCQDGPGDAGGKALDQAGAHCADLRVPLDYANPGGRTITIAISRLKASAPAAKRLGPMIINLGGPALPVLTDVVEARQAMGATGARFDLVGMDQRFAGRSTPLNCRWPDNWLPRGAGRSRASFAEMVNISRDLAGRCASQQGALLPFAGTANAARDMDVIRAALGAPKLNYLGYSYGTYLGALYMQMFPGHAGRIVLDSAINPAHPGVAKGNDGPVREAALRDWARWADQRGSVFHLGATGPKVVATVYRVYRAAGRHPLHVGPFRVDDTVVPGVLLDPLSDDTPVNEAEVAAAVRSLNRAAHGQPARPDTELRQDLAGLLTSAGSALHSAQAAIMCADAPVSRDPASYLRGVQAHRAGAPLFSPVDQTITPCAFWPVQAAPAPHVGNGVPALIVNSSGDINAALPLAKAMHRALTGSRMIVLRHVRTHGVYLFRGSACVDGTVNAYLNSGHLPAHDLSCGRNQ